MERVAIRWTRLALSVPFNDWVDWVEKVRRNRLKVSRFLHRMKTVYSARAFYAWVDARLEMKRQRHVMSRAERYFRRANAQVLSKAFNTWAENVFDNRRRRYALEKIISRWQRLQLSAPFNDWADWVDEVRANRVKLSRFLHRMRTVKTAAAFARWDENRVEMKRQRHVMSRAEGYFRRANAQVLSKAFNTWAENVLDNRRTATCLRRSSADGSACSSRRHSTTGSTGSMRFKATGSRYPGSCNACGQSRLPRRLLDGTRIAWR